MQFGVIVPNFGDYFDPRTLAALAHDAETAGWDGFFLWDHTVAFIARHRPAGDPFDVIATGHTIGSNANQDAAHVQPYANAGATWWLKDISPWTFDWQWEGPWPIDRMNERIRLGPPRP